MTDAQRFTAITAAEGAGEFVSVEDKAWADAYYARTHAATATRPADPIAPKALPLKARFKVTGVTVRQGGPSIELTQVGGDSIGSPSTVSTSLTPVTHLPSTVLTIAVSVEAAKLLTLGLTFDTVLIPVQP